MKNTPIYQEVTVSSGLKVHMRPRTYEEWEKQEQAKITELERISALDGQALGLEAAIQRANLALRGDRLSVWVKDFAKEKGNYSLREIAEVEKIALDMENIEIPLGNSESGGSGQ